MRFTSSFERKVLRVTAGQEVISFAGGLPNSRGLECVIFVSFSKIVSPGIRLGWIAAWPGANGEVDRGQAVII